MVIACLYFLDFFICLMKFNLSSKDEAVQWVIFALLDWSMASASEPESTIGDIRTQVN